MPNNKNIALAHNDFCKQILKVGYSSDGGYWIQDLLRMQNDKQECGIFKYATDINNHGRRKAPILYSAYTSGNVKLSHHSDGRAQISGEGVLSGYNQDGTPKGAAIMSFPLHTTNDGGMVFSFLFWGIQNIKRDGQVTDYILKIDKNRIRNHHQDMRLNAYAIEGYYILKQDLPDGFDYSRTITYNNPIAGVIELTLIPSPDITPGVLGLGATLGHHDFNTELGFTLSGAPGLIYDKKYCDGLSMIYPNKIHEDKGINLNFST